MWRYGIIAIRYSAPFEFPRGVASYHIVLQEPYSLNTLKAQARNGVKAGLNYFKIEPISLERLATEGWILQQDTLDRQNRLGSMTQQEWERMCRAAIDLPGFEAWAATSGDELAAAVIVVRQGPIFSVPFALSHRRFLDRHVNNTLFYCVSKELLRREGVVNLFFTVQSLDAPASVDEFKLRMGFQLKIVRQCVDFHPVIRLFATPTALGWVTRLKNRFPLFPSFSKAEGMLKFYLEGRKPIEEQAWPECLLGLRRQLGPEYAQFTNEKGFRVRSATPLDINALTSLHMACLSTQSHIPVQLGRPFVQAAYRWFLTSPETFVLVARQGDRIIGFTAVSDCPYNFPMLKACWRELIQGYLRHPWTIFNREIILRMVRILFMGQKKFRSEKEGQIAFTGVDPAFQGKGIGRALKEASISRCRERGLVAVITGVRRSNQQARLLNEKAGFLEVPSMSTRDLVFLRLELGNSLPLGKEIKGRMANEVVPS